MNSYIFLHPIKIRNLLHAKEEKLDNTAEAAVSEAQAAEAAEAASTVPLHAFALRDPFGEHPPIELEPLIEDNF